MISNVFELDVSIVVCANTKAEAIAFVEERLERRGVLTSHAVGDCPDGQRTVVNFAQDQDKRHLAVTAKVGRVDIRERVRR